MGKENMAINGYLADRRRFADLFNGIMFHGEQVIRAEDLQEGSEQYHERTERRRDLKMIWKESGLLRVLASENQNQIDYSMPVRIMEYDCLEYRRQLKELIRHNRSEGHLRTPAERLCGLVSTDRLAPVYTLCLYHGEEIWDGPRTLRDMMRFENEGGVNHYFADYPIRLFCVNEQDNFQMLRTELREVFTALNCRRDKSGLYNLIQKDTAYRHLDADTLEVLSVLLNLPHIWKEREKYKRKNGEEEKYDMCLAVQEWRREDRAAGKAEGMILSSKIFHLLKSDKKLSDAAIARECGCSLSDVKLVREAFGI